MRSGWVKLAMTKFSNDEALITWKSMDFGTEPWFVHRKNDFFAPKMIHIICTYIYHNMYVYIYIIIIYIYIIIIIYIHIHIYIYIIMIHDKYS